MHSDLVSMSRRLEAFWSSTSRRVYLSQKSTTAVSPNAIATGKLWARWCVALHGKGTLSRFEPEVRPAAAPVPYFVEVWDEGASGSHEASHTPEKSVVLGLAHG